MGIGYEREGDEMILEISTLFHLIPHLSSSYVSLKFGPKLMFSLKFAPKTYDFSKLNPILQFKLNPKVL